MPFGSLPVKVSEIGFGTSRLANTNKKYVGVKYISVSDARNILQRAIDLGVNFFDTSPTYGTAEKLVGEIKGKYRDKIIVATKAGLRPDGTRDFSTKFLRREIEQSLKDLNVDCLDIFQLNKPSKKDLETQDLFGFLAELKQQGKIKYSGVIIGEIEAGYQCIESGVVDCLQVFYNLVYQDTESLILEARNKGLGILVRSPLNNGLLTGVYEKDHVFDSNDDRGTYFKGDEFSQRLDILRKVQKGLNVSNSQLVRYSFKFILSNKCGVMAIPTASKTCQVDQLVDVANDPSRFDCEELDNIKAIVAEHMGQISFAQQFF